MTKFLKIFLSAFQPQSAASTPPGQAALGNGNELFSPMILASPAQTASAASTASIDNSAISAPVLLTTNSKVNKVNWMQSLSSRIVQPSRFILTNATNNQVETFQHTQQMSSLSPTPTVNQFDIDLSKSLQFPITQLSRKPDILSSALISSRVLKGVI